MNRNRMLIEADELLGKLDDGNLRIMAHLMAGNENVAVYDGSMDEWVGEGLPTTTGESA